MVVQRIERTLSLPSYSRIQLQLDSEHIYIYKDFLKNKGRMAEWSALQTGKRGDSGSIPAEVKTFLFKI